MDRRGDAMKTETDTEESSAGTELSVEEQEVKLPEEAEITPVLTEPAAEEVKREKLRLLQDPQTYTYDDLIFDCERLTDLYSDTCMRESLGKTPDGRSLELLIIGTPQAEKKIFVNAAIHGREYITSLLVMKQTEEFLYHLKKGDAYKNFSYNELLENCAVYVMPMVNPDGVSISQMGLEGIRTDSVMENVKWIAELDGQEAAGEYLTRWKANGNGVDLNRNFDALWETYSDPAGHPSSDHYKGTEPGSEPESAAMISLTESESFERTISYHTQGSVIYWYFGQDGELLERTRAFAERISFLTGYALDDDVQALDPAGYKDWAISRKQIPSLTIEVGREYSPVPWEQLEEIWNRNQYVWEETILDLRE